MEKRDHFSSRIGFLLSTIGFSVGVGTLWRFPYICGQYGGGLFLLAYVFFMIVIGVPLFTAEISLGMASRQSPVKAYQALSGKKKWGIVGLFNMVCIILVVGYTLPVYGWIIEYIYATLTGTFQGMDAQGIADYFNSTAGDYKLVLGCVALNCLLNALAVRSRLQAGLEKIAKILLPILAALMLVLTVQGFFRQGAIEGVKFLFLPDASKFNAEAMLTALGQTFFSLGVGMAVALVFGSYQKEGELNAAKNSLIVSCSVIFVAVLSGLMIFPMVTSLGLEMSAGPGLTFIVMPNVFNSIPGGAVWGTLFYVAFYIAAFSSSISGWETVMRFLMDTFSFSRGKALALTAILVILIGIPATLSDSLFGMFDMLTNNVFLTAGSFMMCVFVGWFWGIDKLAATIGITDNPGTKLAFAFVIRYLAPLAIAAFALSLFGLI